MSASASCGCGVMYFWTFDTAPWFHLPGSWAVIFVCIK